MRMDARRNQPARLNEHAPALLACLALALAGADWARFRGPNGAGISDEHRLPSTFSATENLAWKTELPGPGSSSPIVVGDRIFVTCFTGYGVDRARIGRPEDLKRILLCVDSKSGQFVWRRSVDAYLPEESARGMLADHGFASSTPTSDGERVYVLFGKSGVVAFDLEGTQLWQADVGRGSAAMGMGSGASPVVYNDLVIVNASAESRSLVALRAKTGEQVWKAEADGLGGSWSTPLVAETPDGKKELTVAVPNEVWGLDPETGKLLWFADSVRTPAQCGSLVARDGVVFCTGGQSGASAAIRIGGRGDVTKTHVLWHANAGSYVTSPLVYDGYLYVVSDRGIASCTKADTGEIAYKQRLPGGAKCYASPLLADGKLYVVSRTGGVFVLAAGPEFKVLAHNELAGDESHFDASPVAADGRLILRSNRCLYGIGN